MGNGDAHGKNYSILYAENGPSLAPLYDLMSTIAYVKFAPKHKMAMRIAGNSYLFSRTSRESFSKLSEISGFKSSFILKHLDSIASVICQAARRLAEQLQSDKTTESPIYSKIIDIIERHVQSVAN
jgi:serine/threonine-protein kinase HipA